MGDGIEVLYWVEFEEAPHWRLGVAVKAGELKARSAEEWMGFLREVAMELEGRMKAEGGRMKSEVVP